MSRAEFLNRVRSLYNVDRPQLPELTPAEWVSFREDPARFLIYSDDILADAIWREVERRQAKVTA